MVRPQRSTAETQRKLLYAIVDAVPHPLVVLDDQLRVSLANRSFYETFQVQASDTVNKSLFDLGNGQWDIPPLHQLLTDILPSEGAVEECEVDHEFPVLGRRIMALNARAGINEDGTSRFIVLLFRDITEARTEERSQNQLHAALQKYADELSFMNRDLEAFSYSVSHDLRAPLRSIDGFSLSILEEYADRLDDTGRDYLRRIRAATTAMARVIDDLLELSRLTRITPKPGFVDLSSLARHAIQDLQSANPSRSVTVNIHAGIKVFGDRNLLQVAMVNLMSNAWKFTGTIDDPLIEFDRKGQDGEPVYFVRDNGVGFDMEKADKLMQPFVRLHSAAEFPGSGIGLAIVQRVVIRHGGRLWAESKVGQGATFFFTIGKIDEDIASPS